jgi:hypothetical protein
LPIDLPSVFTVRRHREGLVVMAPSNHPHERAPYCRAARQVAIMIKNLMAAEMPTTILNLKPKFQAQPCRHVAATRISTG